MKISRLHPWNVTTEGATEIQERLRAQVIRRDEIGSVRFVAGIDVSHQGEKGISRAAVVVLHYPELVLCEQAVAWCRTGFPYLPGLLSFREAPAALKALGKLRQVPDLILCDGQGYAHPRRFGLACHIGLLSSIPSIGVAKTRFWGEHAPVGMERGDWQPLIDKGEVIGAALRTRAGVKPVYVSTGHRISLTTALEYVLHCAPRYRLPEPTRQAHHLSVG